MTALGIHFLRGCAVSSTMTRQHPEWPPHPGRVFMAMAAAHFETNGDEEERSALQWIEQQSAPSIKASPGFERAASRGRGPVETYVPVNDKHGGIGARSRQARAFPTVRLQDERVYLVWDEEAPSSIRIALDRLSSKVTRVGHSSSLVQMWLVDNSETVQTNWIPDSFASEQRLRVPEPSTLSNLQAAFARSERPRLTRWQGYRSASQVQELVTNSSIFDPRLIVFEKFEGRTLGLESTLQLTGALRNAAMRALPEGESPEWLSGHAANRAPTTEPHVSFFPLPFVDAPFADGHILGLAMAVPRSVSDEQAKAVIGPLLFDLDSGDERTIRLWRNDGLWEWRLQRETRDRPPTALRSITWTEASCLWASVTPVVLHHYPKRSRDGDVERIVDEAFASAGLPKPKALEVNAASLFEGAPHARSMPEFGEGGGGLCRYQTHVVVRFERPVRGPVLVGRGRFRGYGLFRPIRPKQEHADE